jgi:hypothetical protein
MSAEPPEKLLSQWAQGDLHPDRAIGQILQLIAALQKQLDSLQQQLAALKQQLLKLLPKDKK